MRPERNALTGEQGLAAAIHSPEDAELRGVPLGDVKKACQKTPIASGAAGGIAFAPPRDRLRPIVQHGPPPTLVLPLDQAEELFSADAGPQAEQFLAAAGRRVHRMNATDVGVDRGGHHSHRPLRGDAGSSQPRRRSTRCCSTSSSPCRRSQFKQVITGPAAAAEQADQHVHFAPELVDRLLADAVRRG